MFTGSEQKPEARQIFTGSPVGARWVIGQAGGRQAQVQQGQAQVQQGQAQVQQGQAQVQQGQAQVQQGQAQVQQSLVEGKSQVMLKVRGPKYETSRPGQRLGGGERPGPRFHNQPGDVYTGGGFRGQEGLEDLQCRLHILN